MGSTYISSVALLLSSLDSLFFFNRTLLTTLNLSLQVLGTQQSTAQVHPEKLTKALMGAAQAQGATLRRGTVEAVNVCVDPSPHVTGALLTRMYHWTSQ